MTSSDGGFVSFDCFTILDLLLVLCVELEQVDRYLLVTTLQSSDDVVCQVLLLWSDEGDRCASVASASSPANAMDVVLHVVGTAVVDDQLDLLDVKTSGSD